MWEPRHAPVNDQVIGKKELERESLGYFLEAYEFTTGIRLEYFPLASDWERPDFVCRTPGGEFVGVEITSVMVRPNVKSDLIALSESTTLDAFTASEAVFMTIEEKERKRLSPGWTLPDSTILVIEVFDTDVEELEEFLVDVDLKDDLRGFGFMEIWIANRGTVEPYGGATLFGLFPEKWWGPHECWNHWSKPYG